MNSVNSPFLFALKFTLAILLAWFVSSWSGFDKPYWAMMTVAIIGYPDESLSVPKMIARIVGSVLGVIAVTLIADVSINDRWLLTFFVVLWLTVCFCLALLSRYMMVYLFSLAGYTSSIIAFGTSVYPTPMTIFSLSQERLVEVLIGILSYAFIDYVIPRTFRPVTFTAREQEIQKIKYQTLQAAVKEDRIRAFARLNAFVQTGLSLNTLKKNRGATLHTDIVPMIISTVFLVAGQRKTVSCSFAQDSAERLSAGSETHALVLWQDVAIHLLRLIISLLIGVGFWLNTDWSYGYVLPILISIAFTFGMTFPDANKLALVVLVIAVLAIALGYVLNFFFLIQSSGFVQAALIVSPIFLGLGYLKTRSKLAFLVAHLMCISLIFLIGFSSTMVFDFDYFANISMGLLFSICLVMIMLYLIPPRKKTVVVRDKQRAIAAQLMTAGFSPDKVINTLLNEVTQSDEEAEIQSGYVVITLLSLLKNTDSPALKESLKSAAQALLCAAPLSQVIARFQAASQGEEARLRSDIEKMMVRLYPSAEAV